MVVSKHLPGGTKETHEEPPSEYQCLTERLGSSIREVLGSTLDTDYSN
jgi:hypothetical protein